MNKILDDFTETTTTTTLSRLLRQNEQINATTAAIRLKTKYNVHILSQITSPNTQSNTLSNNALQIHIGISSFRFVCCSGAQEYKNPNLMQSGGQSQLGEWEVLKTGISPHSGCTTRGFD